MRGRWSRVAVVAVGLAVAAGLVALGRWSAGTGAARARGYAAGQAAGYTAGYTGGLRDGRAAGVQEGRALAQTQPLPAGSRDAARAAFDRGYVAGADDAFGGYDGGWSLGVPYLITLGHPGGPITYRIVSRTEMVPGVDYYLCPDGRSICQRRR
jgi:hypothetical protein